MEIYWYVKLHVPTRTFNKEHGFNMEQGFVWTVENNCCCTQDSVNQPNIDYYKFVETVTAEQFQKVPDVEMSVKVKIINAEDLHFPL